MDNFKLDTKEKFNVVTPKTEVISDIKAEELRQILEANLSNQTNNVIINFMDVQEISPKAAEIMAEMAAQYLEKNASFVLCNVSKTVKASFEDLELAEILNITPTESEAWDIVQMEEIERELFSDEEK